LWTARRKEENGEEKEREFKKVLNLWPALNYHRILTILHPSSTPRLAGGAVERERREQKLNSLSKERSSNSSLYVVKIINKIMHQSVVSMPPFSNGAHRTIWVVSLRFQHEKQKAAAERVNQERKCKKANANVKCTRCPRYKYK
jgi:hypothetical protein